MLHYNTSLGIGTVARDLAIELLNMNSECREKELKWLEKDNIILYNTVVQYMQQIAALKLNEPAKW
jgi:hypothetical protein